jgi:hypothetical protein
MERMRNKRGHRKRQFMILCSRIGWWRAPSERIRTASEIPIEMDLTDEDAVPVYMKISEKVLHLRRLGMAYVTIAERLKINLWMAKRAARWGKTHLKRRENTSPY